MPIPDRRHRSRIVSGLACAAALVAVLAFVLAATNDPKTSPVTANPSGTTKDSLLPGSVTLSNYGGLCPSDDGAGQVCSATFTIDPDGAWRSSGSNGSPRTGELTEADRERLFEAVATTRLPDAEEFTGTCPTAYDGQEVTVEFVGLDDVVHDLGTCSRQLDPTDPLLVVLNDLRSTYVTAPRGN